MLEKALPPCRLALLKLIAKYSGEENQSLYIVGGFVRDLLLERPSIDYDIVVEGDAIHFANALAKKFGGRVVPHKRFNTAKWQIRNIHPGLLKIMGYEKWNILTCRRARFHQRPHRVLRSPHSVANSRKVEHQARSPSARFYY